jgi:hypothetical protein
MLLQQPHLCGGEHAVLRSPRVSNRRVHGHSNVIVHLVPTMGSCTANVTTQARQEIRIWRGLTQRHMGVRGRTVT